MMGVWSCLETEDSGDGVRDSRAGRGRLYRARGWEWRGLMADISNAVQQMSSSPQRLVSQQRTSVKPAAVQWLRSAAVAWTGGVAIGAAGPSGATGCHGASHSAA